MGIFAESCGMLAGAGCCGRKLCVVGASEESPRLSGNPPRGCCWRKVLSLTATPACIDSFTVGGCGRDGPGHTTHEPAGAYSPPSRGLRDPV